MSSIPSKLESQEHFTRVFRRDPAGCKRLIICVHGMGDQKRNAMTSSVATLFARGFVKERGKKSQQALRMPQGMWEGKDGANVAMDDVISFVASAGEAGMEPLGEMAFAEIHWADIPRETEKNGYRLEDSPQWAGSVVDRMRQRHGYEMDFSQDDLTLGAAVVEEVAESIRVLCKVLALTEKMGIIPKVDLDSLLDRYLGDVQQVADFRYVRENILKRFFDRVDHLTKLCPDAELHFVAHSEGTVLTLQTLLLAMNKNPKNTLLTERRLPSWLDRVQSLTTFGSPIDKHMILWPEMWGWLSDEEEKMAAISRRKDLPCPKCGEKRDVTKGYKGHCEECKKAAEDWRLQRELWYQRDQHKKIRWRNYYDLADPVGYELDTARQKLLWWGCEAFEFTENDDMGFRRYPLTGKAHVDYFGDVELFLHMRKSAVEGEGAGKLSKPQSKLLGQTSPALPFAIVVVLHLLAVLILHKSLAPESLKNLPAWVTNRDYPHNTGLLVWAKSYWGVLGGGLLMLSVTIFTRTLRIAGWKWGPMLFVAAGVAGTALTFKAVSCNAGPGGLGILLGAAALSCTIASGMDAYAKWKKMSPVWGLRTQMLGGGGLVAAGVIYLFRHPEASLLTAALGGATFIYLWWLAVLLYDLAFVWKRYINTTRKENTFLHRQRADKQWISSGNPRK